jgi:hypothetical protein
MSFVLYWLTSTGNVRHPALCSGTPHNERNLFSCWLRGGRLGPASICFLALRLIVATVAVVDLPADLQYPAQPVDITVPGEKSHNCQLLRAIFQNSRRACRIHGPSFVVLVETGPIPAPEAKIKGERQCVSW